MHQTRVSHHTASAALDFQVSLAWRSPAPELPTMRWIHWPPVPKLAWADVPSVVSALPLARDNAPLSMVQGACLGRSALNSAAAWKPARLDSFKMRLVAQVIAGRW